MLSLQPVSEAPQTSTQPGRVLHLLDVENLMGTVQFSAEEAAHAYATYERLAPSGSVNQLVLATSHYAAPAAWFGFPARARRLVRSGPDGADLALLDILEREAVAKRYQHVVIASGDGIFAFPAAALQAAGCEVTVVTRCDALSRRLRLAVRDVRFIDSGFTASLVDRKLGPA
jgi:hypothetical protein